MMTTAFVCALLAATGDQNTAPDTPRSFVQATLAGTAQPASGATYHRVSPNLSGNALGVVVEGGGFITPSWALEGEFVFAGPVSKAQRFSYTWSEDYVAENRDLLFNELVRWRPGGRMPFELLGGGGVAATRARKLEHTRTDSFIPGRPTTTLPDDSQRVYGFTVTGGIETPLAVNRRVTILPTFRVRWLHRPEPAALGWNGAGSFVFQFGASVRTKIGK